MSVVRILHWRWFPFVGLPKDRRAPFWLIVHWGWWLVLFGNASS